jgi:SAM-dependent methyltransferase
LPESLVYRAPWLYALAMRTLYGRHYGARYRAIADLIPAGSSVLDLCCGPGFLHDPHLRGKRVVYTGLDVNRRFVARVRRRGATALVWDLNDGRELPTADFVVIQASLYQFLPDPAPLLRRMLRAAREAVIVAEPIRNLATSRVPGLGAFAARQTDPGLGARPARFDEPALDAFIAALELPNTRSFLIPGGREKVYVLDPGPHHRGAPSDPRRPAPE